MHTSPTRGISALVLVAFLTAACVSVAPIAGGSPSPIASGEKPVSTDPLVTTVPATAGATRKPRRSRAPQATETAPATSAPTTAPTDAPTTAPTDSPTLPPTAAPTSAAQLNFSLPAVYGSTALTSGFVPDPFSVGITGGGPVSASYLGNGCTGYATSAPSYSVTYTSGAFPLLRFYFEGSGDTTMIINTPSGSYVCVDDSFGTLNPTIDFNTPSTGRYDVWIATFSAGASVAGTMYVTENSGNHP